MNEERKIEIEEVSEAPPAPPKARVEDVVEEDRPRVQAAMHAAIVDGQPYRVEYDIVLPDGSRRHIRELQHHFPDHFPAPIEPNRPFLRRIERQPVASGQTLQMLRPETAE